MNKILPKLKPLFLFANIKESHVIGKPFVNPITISKGEWLLKITEKYPDAPALYCYEQNRQFTYKELSEAAVKLALGLKKEYNLNSKDRIGVYSMNNWEWYVLQLAAALGDLILVNINPAYRPEELSYTINKVRVKVLFISDSFKNSNYIEILKETVPELKNPKSPYNLNSHKFPHLQSIVRFNQPNKQEKLPGFVNFTDLLHEEFSIIKLPKFPDQHDPVNIQFTSGTTGSPKAATLTHHNILNNGLVIGEKCGFTNKDNICIPVPLYHCFGMIMGNLAALTRGAAVTYVGQGFDGKKSLEAVSKYRCTALYGVPTMFLEYIGEFEKNKEKYDISGLRTGIIAGSLASESLMNKIINIMGIKDITNCYGMTETSPVSFQTSPTDTIENKTKSVGTIQPGLEAKIVDDNNKTLPLNKSGELWVKGWSVMPGYWEDPVANEKNIIDGWMKTGDLATLDNQGFLTIVGRSKDMIIRGGENVYPKEIEEFLNSKLEEALDVQVVGVSDAKYGEEIAAVIKVKNLEYNGITNEQILRLCKNHIAHYKIPKYVIFVKDYPLTVTGKVQKFIIRNELEEMKKNGSIEKYSTK